MTYSSRIPKGSLFVYDSLAPGTFYMALVEQEATFSIEMG